MTAQLSSPDAEPDLRPVVVEQVTAGYGGRPVLRAVDLALHGGIVALVGPNGAGKSTLLRVLGTLLVPDSGRVRVLGHDLATRSGRRLARRSLGFLPEEPAFPGEFTVGDMLQYTAWVQRLSTAAAHQALHRVMGQFDLAGFWGVRLVRLSAGMRQRAFLAQATLHDPGVLLLDEPTTKVDPAHRAQLRDLVTRLADNRTVVLTTHLVEDMERLKARLIVLQDGRVAFDGTPGALSEVGLGIPALEAEHPLERALRALARQD